MKENKNTTVLRNMSGSKKDKDKIIGFLYYLVRDYLKPSEIEQIMREMIKIEGEEMVFTNGFLYDYCKNIKERLKLNNYEEFLCPYCGVTYGGDGSFCTKCNFS